MSEKESIRDFLSISPDEEREDLDFIEARESSEGENIYRQANLEAAAWGLKSEIEKFAEPEHGGHKYPYESEHSH